MRTTFSTSAIRHHTFNIPLSSADEGNNFEAIAVVENRLGVLYARDHLKVQLDRYVGRYEVPGEGSTVYTITRQDRQLLCEFYGNRPLELVPHSDRAFSLRWTAGDVEFDLKPDGTVSGLTFRLAGDARTATKIE